MNVESYYGKYRLLPFQKQYDNGFGLLGEKYYEVCKFLYEKNKKEYIVLIFLSRHSIELFLKSIIKILHKYLKIKHSDQNFFTFKRKSYSIYMHDIETLYKYFNKIYKNNSLLLNNKSNFKWKNPKSKYLSIIKSISENDLHGDMYRYPFTKSYVTDASEWQMKSREEIYRESGIELSGLFGKNVYRMNIEGHKKYYKSINELNFFLYELHEKMRYHLTKGK